MQVASHQRGQRWADLPQELVQLTASKLEGADRRALLHTCHGWAAVLEAAPDLLPMAVLHSHDLKITALIDDNLRDSHGVSAVIIRDALVEDAARAERQLFAAAQLSPRLRRVRLSGFNSQLAHLSSTLFALPTGLWELHLDACCSQQLPAVLQRFSSLQTLRITGDASRVDWGGFAASALLAKLEDLHLDFRQGLLVDPEAAEQPAVILEVPLSTVQHLQAATRLRSLALRTTWSDAVPALIAVLPALRQLRLELYGCGDGHAAAAVAALSQLPAHVHYALGVYAHNGHESNHNHPDTEEYDWLFLPPMARLRGLVQLRLVGAVSLPPDWRQLPSLQRLSLVNDENDWEASGSEWGGGPRTSLTALSRVQIRGANEDTHGALPDAKVLATAPALAQVCTKRAPADWLAQLRELRPDLELTS